MTRPGQILLIWSRQPPSRSRRTLSRRCHGDSIASNCCRPELAVGPCPFKAGVSSAIHSPLTIEKPVEKVADDVSLHEAMPHQRAQNSCELCVLPPLPGEKAGVRASVS